jgi:hypothetical protein
MVKQRVASFMSRAAARHVPMETPLANPDGRAAGVPVHAWHASPVLGYRRLITRSTIDLVAFQLQFKHAPVLEHGVLERHNLVREARCKPSLEAGVSNLEQRIALFDRARTVGTLRLFGRGPRCREARRVDWFR